MKDLPQFLRFSNCFIAAFAALIGIIIVTSQISFNVIAILSMISAALACVASRIISYSLDRHYESLQSPWRKFSGRLASLYVLIATLASMTIAYVFLTPISAVFIFANIVLFTIYSRYESNSIYRDLFTGYFAGVILLFAAFVIPNASNLVPIYILSLIIALATATHEITKRLVPQKDETSKVSKYMKDLFRSAIVSGITMAIIFISIVPIKHLSHNYTYVAFIADIIFAYAGMRLLIDSSKYANDSKNFGKLGILAMLIAFLVGSIM